MGSQTDKFTVQIYISWFIFKKKKKKYRNVFQIDGDNLP